MKIIRNTTFIRQLNRCKSEAWQELYKQYYSAMCAYSFSITSNSHACEDIVQETLINIWNLNKEFNDEKELTWYLYRSVYNNSLIYLRNNKQDTISIESSTAKINTQSLSDNDEFDFELTIREELIRNLNIIINELPEQQKQIILLSLDGKSGKEISNILGISINTIKTQKNRSFKFLRENIQTPILLFLLKKQKPYI